MLRQGALGSAAMQFAGSPNAPGARLEILAAERP